MVGEKVMEVGDGKVGTELEFNSLLVVHPNRASC
jgi:hypothetical protein